jgi:hypothetical protein
MIKIGENKYEVLNISQRGLRILKTEKKLLPYHVSGRLTLLCGESVSVEAFLVWEHDENFALYLKNVIPLAVIEKEQSYVQKQRI